MLKKSFKFTNNLFDAFNYLLLSISLLLCIYPFYYIFIYSISDSNASAKGLFFLPKSVTLTNYVGVFKLEGIGNATLISIARTVLGTVLTIFGCSFLAYLMTKKEMYLRRLLYRLLIITMYFNAGLIPWYLTMKMYRLNDNFLLYIVPTIISAYFVLLLKTFIEQISPSMEESAKIDGAGYFTIFTRIIFPLSMPIVATIAVFSAVNQWNTWMDNWFLVEDPNLKTLQVILYDYLRDISSAASATMQEKNSGMLAREISPQTVRMTITMVVTLPIIFIYPFLQRYFVKGLMMGAIKG
jgi:putative aldouronate transport system permease protein